MRRARRQSVFCAHSLLCAGSLFHRAGEVQEEARRTGIILSGCKPAETGFFSPETCLSPAPARLHHSTRAFRSQAQARLPAIAVRSHRTWSEFHPLPVAHHALGWVRIIRNRVDCLLYCVFVRQSRWPLIGPPRLTQPRSGTTPRNRPASHRPAQFHRLFPDEIA